MIFSKSFVTNVQIPSSNYSYLLIIKKKLQENELSYYFSSNI